MCQLQKTVTGMSNVRTPPTLPMGDSPEENGTLPLTPSVPMSTTTMQPTTLGKAMPVVGSVLKGAGKGMQSSGSSGGNNPQAQMDELQQQASRTPQLGDGNDFWSMVMRKVMGG